MMKTNNDNNNKIKQPWDCNSECNNNNNNNVEDGDLFSGYPWPPRSYTCSFCKREFRSAQALGGHMNVHRRDRARLRIQSPPRDHVGTLLNLNVEPNPSFIFNPNPNFSSSSSSKFPPFTSTLPSSLSPPLSTITSPSSASATGQWKKWEKTRVLNNHLSLKNADFTKTTTKAFFGVEDLGSLRCEKGCSIMKKAEIVTLDLEIGLLSDTKQDLDLELRLGYI